MITSEMLKKAIVTSHESCVKECIHEDAFRESAQALEEEIAKCVGYALSVGVSPALMIYSAGIHVGYQLHAIETEPIAKELVN